MEKPSLLAQDEGMTSFIVCIDRDIDNNADKFPIFAYSSGSWSKFSHDYLLSVIQGNNIKNSKGKKIAGLLSQSGNIMSALICSEGGGAGTASEFCTILRKGEKSGKFLSQAIVGSYAQSAAAGIAISASSIYANDASKFMFHMGYDIKTGETVDYIDGHEYPSAYHELLRLEKIAANQLVFANAGIRRRFMDVLDNPRATTDEYIEFDGNELRRATILKGHSITSEDIIGMIDKIRSTKPTKELLKKLESFQRSYPQS